MLRKVNYMAKNSKSNIVGPQTFATRGGDREADAMNDTGQAMLTKAIAG